MALPLFCQAHRGSRFDPSRSQVHRFLRAPSYSTGV